MNKGIKLAEGSWLIFMNAGDEFYNKNILNNLSKFCYKNKDRDIIFGDTVINNSYMKYKAVSNYFDKNILLMPFCHQFQ